MSKIRLPGKKQRERFKWIVNRIQTYGSIDVLNSETVDGFAETFKLTITYSFWGANWCAQLGKDLSLMYKIGILERWACGLGCNWQLGFPKWIYSYSLGPNASDWFKFLGITRRSTNDITDSCSSD